jgi:hypothetical protein
MKTTQNVLCVLELVATVADLKTHTRRCIRAPASLRVWWLSGTCLAGRQENGGYRLRAGLPCRQMRPKARIKADMTKWAKMIRDADIRP